MWSSIIHGIYQHEGNCANLVEEYLIDNIDLHQIHVYNIVEWDQKSSKITNW